MNKYLSQIGYCSRRDADRLIAAGAVTVNGRLPEMGDKVTDTDEILVHGKPLQKEEEKILLILNKPKGIVCTTARFDRNNVIDFLQYPKRVYPVGRLDKDSEGLLLLTNQGDLVNRLMRGGNRHEKEYLVTVNRPVTNNFLQGMAKGVYLEELHVTTRPCKVERIDGVTFRMVLTQGLNRQIRRMCACFGYRVVKLRRTRIMNIELGDLPTGKCRSATPEEMRRLWEAVKDSSNETVKYEKRGRYGTENRTDQRTDRAVE